MTDMNEALQRQLIRQLKLLNFWITFFGVLTLVAIGIIGFLLFQVITFMQTTSQEIREFQQTTSDRLDVRQQACNDDSLGGFLRDSTEVCN